MPIEKRKRTLPQGYDFKAEMNVRVMEAETIVKSYLPKVEGFQSVVLDAMNYSVNAGGKRLRPLLMMESFRTFGGKNDAIMPFMAALEFIHTYSLVHDDLPAMDNDELRRGQPTTWKVYGDAMGVLAGDALLNYAFETACKSFQHAAEGYTLSRGGFSVIEDHLERKVPAANLMKALEVLSQKAGVFGMVGGQVADVADEGKKISAEEMEFIHTNKTCALIEAALMIGAILAGAGERYVEKMEKIGHALGMAFQIQDDILDVTSTTEELGKPVGSDVENDKNTYVSLYGLEESKKLVEQYTEEAVKAFESLDKPNDFLKDLMLYLVHRKN